MSVVKDKLLPAALELFPQRLVHSMLDQPVVMPYYHIVSDERVPHVAHLYSHRSVKQFEEDLDHFLAQYVPVSVHDLLSHLHGEKRLPEKPLFLSFDDGFREMAEVVAPILLRKGVPATFFLTSNFVDNTEMAHHCKASLLVDELMKAEGRDRISAICDRLGIEAEDEDLFRILCTTPYTRKDVVDEAAMAAGVSFDDYLVQARPYMSTGEVKKMLEDGFTIGGHSIDHPLYADLDLEEQLRQTRESVSFVTERFGLSYRVFAFPHKDEGVGSEFFSRVLEGDGLDLLFGTGGIKRHECARNLQRVSMEKSSQPASRVMSRAYAKGIWVKWREGERRNLKAGGAAGL